MPRHTTTIDGRFGPVSLWDTEAEARAIADANQRHAERGDRYDVVMTPNQQYAVALICDGEFIGNL